MCSLARICVRYIYIYIYIYIYMNYIYIYIYYAYVHVYVYVIYMYKCVLLLDILDVACTLRLFDSQTLCTTDLILKLSVQ